MGGVPVQPFAIFPLPEIEVRSRVKAFVFGANGQDGPYFSLPSTGFGTVVESAPRAERAMTPSA